MIKLININKYYGNFHAIKNLSFEIKEGELIGLIGPNGAGKTTIIKCIAGLSKPSSGEIIIDGIDKKEDSTSFLSYIGYLPEETPLVEELTVKEYLNYRYALKSSFKANGRSVDETIELCGLKNVENRVIVNLSKGFKQRTGIAESLLCSPKILILDEPGNGLDPEQIINIRTLLLKLKNEHTIIVSSHILSELELICDRFLMISHGEMKIIGNKYDILSRSLMPSSIEIELKEKDDKLIDVFKSFSEVIDIQKYDNDKSYILKVKSQEKDIRLKIIETAAFYSNSLLTIKWIKPNLESLYMELCGD